MIFGALGIFALIAVPIIVVIAITTLIIISTQKNNDIKVFERVIRNIYLYTISIICTIMLIVGVIGTVVKTMDIFLPTDIKSANTTSAYQQTIDYNRKVGNIKGLVAFITTLGIGIGGVLYHGAKVKALKKED